MALAREQDQHDRASRNHHAATLLDRLTDRESAVLKQMLAGKSNKEIGRHLGISHRTVEIHKAHLMEKTGAASLIDLTRIARDAGIDE